MKGDLHVGRCQVDRVWRCLDQEQNRPADQESDTPDHDSHDKHGHIQRVYGTPDTIQVACTEILGNDDTRTHAQPNEQGNNHENDRKGRPDRSQRFSAYKAADDRTVDHVVKLLEQIAQEHRNGKAHEQTVGTTLHHIERSAIRHQGPPRNVHPVDLHSGSAQYTPANPV